MYLNPLEQLNPITMAAIAAIFLAAFFILRRAFFLPLIEVMKRRAGKLERARARLEEAGALIEKARGEAARTVAAATEAAEHRLNGAAEELARVRESKTAQANAEAEGILARGREEVLRLRETEQEKLTEHLLACSRQTLVKLIGEVDEEMLRFVVGRVLAARGEAK